MAFIFFQVFLDLMIWSLKLLQLFGAGALLTSISNTHFTCSISQFTILIPPLEPNLCNHIYLIENLNFSSLNAQFRTQSYNPIFITQYQIPKFRTQSQISEIRKQSQSLEYRTQSQILEYIKQSQSRNFRTQSQIPKFRTHDISSKGLSYLLLSWPLFS